MLHDKLSFIIRDSLPDTASISDIVYVSNNDMSGLFLYDRTRMEKSTIS